MHTFTSLIGAPLRVELQSGKIFEGILTVGNSSLQKLKVITQLFADFFSWLWGSAGGGSWGEPLTVDHSNREKAIFSTLNKWTFSFSLFCTYFINLCFYLRWSNLTLTLLMWRQSSPKLSSPWKMLSSKSTFLRSKPSTCASVKLAPISGFVWWTPICLMPRRKISKPMLKLQLPSKMERWDQLQIFLELSS